MNLGRHGKSANSGGLDEDMEELSLGQLGSAGGIGTSSASRARMLAMEREKQMKKQRANAGQMGNNTKPDYKRCCNLL